MNLTEQEAKNLIEKIGDRLGYDYTHAPLFPEGRNDVCVIVHTTENGSTYGFDTVFLVWKEPTGSISHKEITNSRSTKDYIHVESIIVNADGSISLGFGSGGSYSGTPWSAAMKATISNQNASISNVPSILYAEQAKLKMLKVIEDNQHIHPMYLQTRITEYIIDENSKKGAFILLEQIDTDRGHEDGEGYLGDQFRYSLWKICTDDEPIRIHEDHAYIRPRTINTITNTRGRDCTLKNLTIKNDTIQITHLEGERVEKQEPEILIFKF